jgi:hypothetical protein
MALNPSNKSWEDRVRLFLKAEIKRADISYEELAARLKDHGINENAASLANKLARGTFAATWFLACLEQNPINLYRIHRH